MQEGLGSPFAAIDAKPWIELALGETTTACKERQ